MLVVKSHKVTSLQNVDMNKWIDVHPDDEMMIKRWLNVMYQADRRYCQLDVEDFGIGAGHCVSDKGGSFYFCSQRWELALRMGYAYSRNQHQIVSIGMAGEISPRDALDLVLVKTLAFLRTAGASSAVAIPPKQMDNSKLTELHRLVLEDPRMRVSVERESRVASRWNIIFSV